MWVVAWQNSLGLHVEEAADEEAAETRQTILRNKGITRAVTYEVEDQQP